MKQILMNKFGEPEVLEAMERQIPEIAEGELLIRVEAAGVNYSDLLRRTNSYFMPTPLPFVPGAEAVGEIVRLGPGSPDHFQEGMRVLAILPSGGGYAEYVKNPFQYCVPLPPQVDPKEATSMFVQGSTAHLILHHCLQEIKGKTILVHAAGGGVGNLLVQLGKLAGARIVATAGSINKLELAQQLGADLSINYSQKDWAERLIEANGGQKVDIVLESVGGEIYKHSFQCLRTFGQMVVYGAASRELGLVHSEHFVDQSHQLMGFNLAHMIGHYPEIWQHSLAAMIGLLTEGKIQVPTPHSYPLSDAWKAHSDMENRKTAGKVVLIP